MPVRTGWLKAAWTAEFMAGVVLPAAVVPTAFNSGVNLLYLLGSMLLAYMLLAFLMGLWNMTNVHGEVALALEVEEGRPLALPARIENRGKRPAFDVQVRVPFAGLPEHPVARFPFLGPGEEARGQATCPAPGRGLYPLERYTVESPYPIGFMRTQRRSWLLEPGELAVLPRLLEVDFREAFGADQTLEGEDILAHGAHGGTTYYGVRGYVFGDPLKHVHWKVSARVGELVVKEYQRPLQARYFLFLDLDEEQLEGAGPESNLEYLIRLAASLGQHLEASRALYHLVWWDQDAGAPRVSDAFTQGDLSRARYLLAGLRYHPGSRIRDMVVASAGALPPASRLVFFVPREVQNIPEDIAGVGFPTKAIFLVRTRTAREEEAEPQMAGETGLAAGVDLYRYSIDHDRLDHEAC